MEERLENGAQPADVIKEDGVVRPDSGASAAWRAVLVLGLAAASLGVAAIVLRSALRHTPSDPTTERIQALIDEANRLLKQLDDQKNT
ncbi:MAG: hypothetical protein JO060_01715 [Candidatus Eremiobacteraeota bacterium]|nr:hypothetical protein [Candidatus Eremiobacteraeota bacterium]MBV9647011.1 hypothetical protein [Candidatus Eremiobacteraeota bacterium]